MAQPARLQLTQHHPAMEGDVFRFDRRLQPRRRVSGRVTALLNPGQSRENKRICSLQLANLSDGGVGATTQESIAVGQRIVMFFPDQGAEPGFDAYGEVTRCSHNGELYSIGVRLDTPRGRCSA